MYTKARNIVKIKYDSVVKFQCDATTFNMVKKNDIIATTVAD